VLGRSEVLQAVVDASVVIVDPLVEGGIEEFLVHPCADLELRVLGPLQVLSEYRDRFKGLSKELNSVVLICLEPLSDEFLFALDHGPDFSCIGFPPTEGFLEVVTLP